MSAHKVLLELAKKLHSIDTPEILTTFTLRWLDACLLNEEPLFHAQIQKILSKQDKLDELVESINTVKKKKTALTANDNELLDILAFTDSKYVASDKIHTLGGVVNHYSQSMMVTQQEMTLYLDELTTLLNSSTSNPGKPLVIQFSNGERTIGAIYQIGKGWKSMDLHQYPPVDGEQSAIIASKLFAGFKTHTSSPYVAFNTTLLTTKPDFNELLCEQLDQFSKKHAITDKMVLREETINLLWLAAALGDTLLVRDLVPYTTTLNIHNLKGRTPIHAAAKNGFDDVIDELAKQAAELNTADCLGCTPALIGAALGHTSVVKILSQYDINMKQAVIIAADPLREFARAFNVIDKMDAFIKKQLALSKDSTKIAISPYDIALIMNHHSVVLLIDKNELQDKFSSLLSDLRIEVEVLKRLKISNPRYTDVSQAATTLYEEIKKEYGLFFERELTTENIALSKQACEKAIAKAELKFKDDTNAWSRIHPILKGILFILASITIIPAIIIAATSQFGYIGTFFTEPVKGMSEKFATYSSQMGELKK